MQVGDIVYYIDTNKVKEAEVIKITRDFVTLRYKSNLNNRYETNGGLRIRTSKAFASKEEAENILRGRKIYLFILW